MCVCVCMSYIQYVCLMLRDDATLILSQSSAKNVFLCFHVHGENLIKLYFCSLKFLFVLCVSELKTSFTASPIFMTVKSF